MKELQFSAEPQVTDREKFKVSYRLNETVEHEYAGLEPALIALKEVSVSEFNLYNLQKTEEATFCILAEILNAKQLADQEISKDPNLSPTNKQLIFEKYFDIYKLYNILDDIKITKIFLFDIFHIVKFIREFIKYVIIIDFCDNNKRITRIAKDSLCYWVECRYYFGQYEVYKNLSLNDISNIYKEYNDESYQNYLTPGKDNYK